MKSNRSTFTVLAALATGILATSASASKYSDTIMADTSSTGLRAYWQFDEAANTTLAAPTYFRAALGTTLENSFSYINSGGGVPGGVKTTAPAGIVGSAVHVQTGTNPGGIYGNSFNPDSNLPVFDGQLASGSFSIEYWIKPITDNRPNLKITAGGGTGFVVNHGTGVDIGGYFQPTIGFSSNPDPFTEPTKVINPADMSAVNPLTVGQWAFVVFTFQSTGASTGNAAYYVNGVDQLDPTTYPLGYKQLTGLSRTAWNLLSIGSSDELGFDELAVFDHALTQNEILNQFDAIPEPGMLSLLALGGAFMVWRRRVAAKRA